MSRSDTRDHEYAAEGPSCGDPPPTSPMPFCPLYETRFRAFPPKCPLAYRNPAAQLNTTQRLAWKLVGRDTGSAVGLIGLKVLDVCNACTAGAHPWVQFLRKKYNRT